MATTVKALLDRKNIKEIISIRPEATVFEALVLMAESNIGALLVMDGEKLVGIFSERDYARKGIIKERKAKSTIMLDVMTANVFTVSSDKDIVYCMEMMSSKKFRHLPVIDGEKVIGILSVGDIVTVMILEQKSHINFLENYISS